MTQFDILVLILLGVSAFVGFVRGAVREIVALIALFAAAGIAVFGLPVFAPLVRSVVSPPWLASAVALVAVFLVVLIALRLLGAGLARQVRNTQMLGILDRALGLLIGLGRGMVILGALYLMFNAATPADLQPGWMTGARSWPAAARMGKLLQDLAPRGLDLAGRLKPAFARAVHDGSRDRTTTEGYEASDPDRLEISR